MTDQQKRKCRGSAESGRIKWVRDNCLRMMDSGDDYVFFSNISEAFGQQ